MPVLSVKTVQNMIHNERREEMSMEKYWQQATQENDYLVFVFSKGCIQQAAK